MTTSDRHAHGENFSPHGHVNLLFEWAINALILYGTLIHQLVSAAMPEPEAKYVLKRLRPHFCDYAWIKSLMKYAANKVEELLMKLVPTQAYRWKCNHLRITTTRRTYSRRTMHLRAIALSTVL